MMRGLPASGKTTLAKQIMEQGGNYCRVNKDSLRKMLHFSKFTPANEGVVNDIEAEIVRKLLEKGKNVIIDDTNLTKKHEERWSGIANECNAKFNINKLKTPMDECIQRDAFRGEDSVGEHVIRSFSLVLGNFPASKFVICDLDGTLCDVQHRLHYVKKEKPEWKNFYSLMHADPLKEKTRDMILDIVKEDHHKIIFMSGRPDTYRKETEEWLNKNVPEMMTDENFGCILMRRDTDKRSDVEVKQSLYDRHLSKYTVTHVFDDRGVVIDGVWKPLVESDKIRELVEVDRWEEP